MTRLYITIPRYVTPDEFRASHAQSKAYHHHDDTTTLAYDRECFGSDLLRAEWEDRVYADAFALDPSHCPRCGGRIVHQEGKPMCNQRSCGWE